MSTRDYDVDARLRCRHETTMSTRNYEDKEDQEKKKEEDT